MRTSGLNDKFLPTQIEFPAQYFYITINKSLTLGYLAYLDRAEWYQLALISDWADPPI